MIYSTSTKTFKSFLMTKEKLLATCFPDQSEANLVNLISDFSKSRTTQDFANLWRDFSKELKEWGNMELTGTLKCDFIPIDQRLKLLRDMLGLKEMDPIEVYNLTQLLSEL